MRVLLPKAWTRQAEILNSSIASSAILVVVTVTLAGAMEMGMVLMLEVVASPERSANISALYVPMLGLELLQFLSFSEPESLHFPSVLCDTL